jgi:hypothetical protein
MRDGNGSTALMRSREGRMLAGVCENVAGQEQDTNSA